MQAIESFNHGIAVFPQEMLIFILILTNIIFLILLCNTDEIYIIFSDKIQAPFLSVLWFLYLLPFCKAFRLSITRKHQTYFIYKY